MKITNTLDISLPMAVWLLTDDYDYINDPRYVSATSLLKATKQLVLGKRVESSDREMDVSERIASRIGTAIHDSVEKSWTSDENRVRRLVQLGYPEHVAERIVINPTTEELRSRNDAIALYLEQRNFRELDGWKIGGKFDMILDGRLFDYKTTSVWTFIKGSKDADYALQGGIYRWLNPSLVTDDHIYIQFLFTDWQKSMVGSPGYPASRILEHPVKLPPIEEVERYLRAKLRELSRCADLPEDQIPECTDEDLWRSAPQFKYYANPDKTDGRATRNFDTAQEANAFQAEKGGKGVVKHVPGEVKACAYCPAFAVCKQKDRYL